MISITRIKRKNNFYAIKTLTKSNLGCSVIPMTNTTETLNTLIKNTFTNINDSVYCKLLDMGVNPQSAYEIAFIDIPSDPDQLTPDFKMTTSDSNHDDVSLMLL